MHLNDQITLGQIREILGLSPRCSLASLVAKVRETKAAADLAGAALQAKQPSPAVLCEAVIEIGKTAAFTRSEAAPSTQGSATIWELSDYLARAIFAACSTPHDHCQRIAFKGGKYPDHETDLGGLCLTALRHRIDDAIKKRPHFLPGGKPRRLFKPRSPMDLGRVDG